MIDKPEDIARKARLLEDMANRGEIDHDDYMRIMGDLAAKRDRALADFVVVLFVVIVVGVAVLIYIN